MKMNNSFCQLLQSQFARPIPFPVFADQPPDCLSIGRGLAWPILLSNPSSRPAMDLLAPLFDESFDPDEVEIFDRAGHRRSADVGLLCYAALHALAASNNVLLNRQAAFVAQWAQTLAERGGRLPIEDGQILASNGSEVAGCAWASLAAFAAADLLHDEGLQVKAARQIRQIATRQTPTGAFLQASLHANPETLWFHELQILHALASYSMQSGDPVVLSAVCRSANFHLRETQPDHATQQPWGLPAFLCDSATVIMADQLLHSARMRLEAEGDAVTLILLADTLYSCRRHSEA